MEKVLDTIIYLIIFLFWIFSLLGKRKKIRGVAREEESSFPLSEQEWFPELVQEETIVTETKEGREENRTIKAKETVSFSPVQDKNSGFLREYPLNIPQELAEEGIILAAILGRPKAKNFLQRKIIL